MSRGERLQRRFFDRGTNTGNSGKDTHNRSGNQIGHGARQHRADAEFGELIALLRGKRADAADLNADGAEVRKATKSEGCDRETARVQRSFHGAKLREG